MNRYLRRGEQQRTSTRGVPARRRSLAPRHAHSECSEAPAQKARQHAQAEALAAPVPDSGHADPGACYGVQPRPTHLSRDVELGAAPVRFSHEPLVHRTHYGDAAHRLRGRMHVLQSPQDLHEPAQRLIRGERRGERADHAQRAAVFFLKRLDFAQAECTSERRVVAVVSAASKGR